MYNEEEINDSLEFCQDIDIYYENKKELGFYEQCKKESDKNKLLQKNSFVACYSTFEENYSLVKEEKGFGKVGIFQKIIRSIGTLFAVFFLSYGISSFLSNYCMWQTVVDGISMEPALEDGDKVIIDKWTYHFKEPKRFDIIVFPQDIDIYYVKRIIGLPGETVEIRDGRIYVDGMVLIENYGKEKMPKNYSMDKRFLLEDEYFVLGDNRNHSVDSREYSVGAVKRERIVGKAKVILYPFENIRVFK